MISLWEVLKASKGLPVSDFYAAMWGKQIAGKYTIAELEGALPLTFNSNGESLIDYRIYGNTVQDGTPTPENPIMPIGCGERTENVMPSAPAETKTNNGITATCDGNGVYTLSGTALSGTYIVFRFKDFTIPISVGQGGQGTMSLFNTVSSGQISIAFLNDSTSIDVWLINSPNRKSNSYIAMGGTVCNAIQFYIPSGNNCDCVIKPCFTNDSIYPANYIPYGYKLPITLGSTTTNIYLGEVQSTRRIKKLVLTGEEVWAKGTYAFNSTLSGVQAYAPVLCTHYQYFDGASSQAPTNSISTQSGGGTSIWIKTQNHNDTTIEQWKSYLAQQYAAGTPVTVWYVLAEPEIGIVNEPLMKIGDYADTVSMEQTGVNIPTYKGTNIIDYDGTPKPSQMYIKYLR